MKVSFNRLALSGLVVLSGVGILGSSALSGPADGKADAPRLRVLLTQKRDLLQQIETDRRAQYAAGTTTTEQVERASIAVIEADLVARSRRERIALRQKRVDIAAKMEQEAQARSKAAVITPAELQEAQLARLEAEIALEREKSGK